MPCGLKIAGATYQKLETKMFCDYIGKSMEVYIDDMFVKSKKKNDHLSDLNTTFQVLRCYQMRLNAAKCTFGVSSDKFLGFLVNYRGIEVNPEKTKELRNIRAPTTVKEMQMFRQMPPFLSGLERAKSSNGQKNATWP